MSNTGNPTGENPFDGELARANSNYNAWRSGGLVQMSDPDHRPSPLTEFVHDSFRGQVLSRRFSCVGAKSAFRKGTYRFGMYGELGSPGAAAGLAHDLFTFHGEWEALGPDFATFVASFSGPTPAHEAEFEQLLWAQLQALHNEDASLHAWDPAVSADPDSPQFSYSFAGRAYFVVGMHPASSRWTRRFAWPTLVFNPHSQFERLRERGRFTRFRDVIRGRERALQGDINPVLRDYGEQSEARQYSGRAVEPEWSCPFHAHRAAGTSGTESPTGENAAVGRASSFPSDL